jgi:3-oxoacyl-[acyl-carrier protein] reductase
MAAGSVMDHLSGFRHTVPRGGGLDKTAAAMATMHPGIQGDTAMTKLAIITGGARGIGRACALALAEKGLDIALIDLLQPEMARTAAELRALGRTARIYQADVSDHARAATVVHQIAADFGRIDVLVNNAGRGNPKGILDITETEFDRTIAVNLKSCFNFIQPCVPTMRANGGGRIISMSSLNAATVSSVTSFSRAIPIATRRAAACSSESRRFI